VIFGLFHGNLVQIPFAFIVGIVLGWVVTSTNSMLPAILIHFSNNLFSVICSALQNNHKSLGISISTINIFVTLFIIVMGILSLYFSVKLSRTDRSFLSLSNYYGELSKQEIKHAVITSPFLIASVIMLIFETVVNHIG